MIILTLRTDKPEAEVGLFHDHHQLQYEIWHAHRALSTTIHTTIEKILSHTHHTWQDMEGIICYQGPGSFTGLRIGISVANSLAYSLDIPIVAAQNEHWIEDGTAQLLQGTTQQVIQPFYGSPVHITTPRK